MIHLIGQHIAHMMIDICWNIIRIKIDVNQSEVGYQLRQRSRVIQV
jgi:hypothetical protein